MQTVPCQRSTHMRVHTRTYTHTQMNEFMFLLFFNSLPCTTATLALACDLSSACHFERSASRPQGENRETVSWHQVAKVCVAGMWLSDDGAYHAHGPRFGLALKREELCSELRGITPGGDV